MNDPYSVLRDVALELSQAKTRPISYLEIGTSEGGSAVVALESGVGLAVLADTWGRQYGGSGRGSPAHIVALLGPAMARIVIITGDSAKVLPMLTHSFDLIFVDGDHSHEGCLTDMTNALRLLSPGGVMLVDDIDNEHHRYLRQTVTDFAAAHGLTMKTHAVHAGIAELRRV